MNFDKHRVLVGFCVWCFLFSIITPYKAFAMEVASPSTLYHESTLEGGQTVLNERQNVSSNVYNNATNRVVSTTVPKINNVSLNDLKTLNAKAVEFEELEGKKILVLDDSILYYASDSNLKRNNALKSVGRNSSIYGSLTSSTALTFFEGYVKNLSPFDDYVIWRESQYVYTLVYGDLTYSDGSFSGSGNVVSFNVGNYQTDYTVSHSTVSSFSLSPGNYIVYSSFYGFPCLGGGMNEKIEVLGLYVPFIFLVIWILFKCIPYRFSRKIKPFDY